MFGQRIGAATAAIALALVAAACGGGDDEGGGTTGAATQAAAGGSKLEGEITTWSRHRSERSVRRTLTSPPRTAPRGSAATR